jgi:iron complex transport system ATP-binding protein
MITDKKLDIKVVNLELEYSGKKVLQNISLEINNNELIAIIGPNGAGKSSFLKIISQSIKPSAGVIYLNQKDLQSYNKNELSRIRAFVSAEENINNEFISVLQYLTFGRAPYQNWLGTLTETDKQVIESCINATGVQDFLDKNISELSSGERQRVQITRSLIQEPSLLLLDEPTSHLDISYQLEIMKLLKKISVSGVKIITILHDLNLASFFCNRLLLLKKGEIVCFGNPSEVLTEANLENVFKNRWEIINNVQTGRPKVFPRLG